MSYEVSPTGPCHALGGAAHRCDGPPSLVDVTFARGRVERFRWCPAACIEAATLAAQEREPLRIEFAFVPGGAL